MTIRSLLEDYRNELSKEDMPYMRGADILKELSALFGNVTDEIIKRDMDYHRVLKDLMAGQLAVSKAKIIAETTAEYEAMRYAHAAEQVILEMIRSLKYWLKAKEDERSTSKFQEG